MTESQKKCVEIQDNKETLIYFDRLTHIIEKIEQISKKEGEKDDIDSIRHIIVKSHLESLKNTIKAISMKHRFNAMPNNRNSSRLYIDVVNSGFPLEKEISHIEANISMAETELSEMESKESIKEKIVNYAIAQKSINKDLQYLLSQRMYYDFILKEKDNLFLSLSSPQVKNLGTNKSNSNEMYIIHWSSYDPVKNHPIVYIMYFEASGKDKENIQESSEFSKMIEKIKNHSISSILLLNMATEIDKACPSIHPKNLSRIHLGPIYKNGITEHNNHVKEILDECNDPVNNWIFCVSTESIQSKSQTTVKTGMFSEQVSQIFELDSENTEAMESKVSHLEQSIVFPYEIFQRLSEFPENPLNKHKKYVVKNNEVLYL